MQPKCKCLWIIIEHVDLIHVPALVKYIIWCHNSIPWRHFCDSGRSGPQSPDCPLRIPMEDPDTKVQNDQSPKMPPGLAIVLQHSHFIWQYQLEGSTWSSCGSDWSGWVRQKFTTISRPGRNDQVIGRCHSGCEYQLLLIPHGGHGMRSYNPIIWICWIDSDGILQISAPYFCSKCLIG